MHLYPDKIMFYNKPEFVVMAKGILLLQLVDRGTFDLSEWN